jgi:hypothetical protein
LNWRDSSLNIVRLSRLEIQQLPQLVLDREHLHFKEKMILRLLEIKEN